MKKLRFITAALLCCIALCSQAANKGNPLQNKDAIRKTNTEIKVGAEQMEKLLPLLRNKRVALVVNHTSLVGKKRTHLLDSLLSCAINVQKVFAPEHGFRGNADAGEKILDGKDTKTGISIISLYGKNKKPTADQLSDIDVVLFDIQDVGARFYTYISTMHYVMEACAENNKPLIIADRPNPYDYVDGPVMKANLRSFVGMHLIPLLHGCTVGELAKMINGEGWLEGKRRCQLTVIKVKNWKHKQAYSLPVKPSPNLPNDQAIRLYASLCPFEATNISVGRGTNSPFQVLGAPDSKFGNYTFVPESLAGSDKNPLHKGLTCYGEDLRKIADPKGFSLKFFISFYNNSGQGAEFFSKPRWFDQLMGDATIRKEITDGKSEAEIKANWQKDLIKYKNMRSKYLLYTE